MHANVTAFLVMALTIAGRDDEAMAAAEDLPDAAEATGNPYALSLALMAYGFAWRDADPDRARETMHRGLAIAHDSGSRFNETHISANLAQLEVDVANPCRHSTTSVVRSATCTIPATSPLFVRP